MNFRFHFILVAFLVPLPAVATTAGWPQFRGPSGDGVAESTNLPVEWAEDKNVTWKTPIHGKAWSSPVILGDQIWLK